ncbi:MAG TPA: hypothetical protein VGG78_07800, partial [Gemmatimonadaceae bacterium]
MGRLALVVTAIVVALLVVLLVLTNTSWGNERVRRILVSQANGRLTGRLDVGRLRGNLLSDATLTDVRIVDSVHQPFFSARRVHVRYGLWAALQRRVVLHSVVLDTPFVMLDKRPGARWNFQALMRPSAAPKDTSSRGAPPEIGDILIHHGQFVYRRPWQPDSTLPANKRDAAIAAALGPAARSRTERVTGGFQRVVEYRDIDAHIPELHLARTGRPASVRIAALAMIGEPYRPPYVDVRSLTATLYFSKDSLWWHDARMSLPASQVTGDGRIGFNKSGFALRLDVARSAFADLRWLNPRLPVDGGGRFKYTMRVHGDTAEYAVADADMHYHEATVAGSVSLTRVQPVIGKSTVLVRSADVVVARLTTDALREIAPSLKLYRRGTIDGRAAVSGTPGALHLDADVQFDDARSGHSRLIARGGLGIGDGFRARDLAVDLRPLQLASLAGTPVHVPLGGTVTGSATINGASQQGWHVRGDLTHVDGTNRSHVVGDAQYQSVGKRILADAHLEPLSLATVGRFFPVAELRGSVAGRVHAEGTTRDLRVSGALLAANGGTLDIRGGARLAGGSTRYDVAATLDALDVFSLTRRAPHTRLTGTLTARGRGISLASGEVALTANLGPSRYDTLSIDRLVARLTASNGLLHADTFVVDAVGAEARAAGTLGLVTTRSGDMKVDVVIDSLGALRRWLGTNDSSRVLPASARQAARLAAARSDSIRRAEAVRIERLALGLPPGVTLAIDTLPSLRKDSLAGSLRADATLHGNIKRLGVDAHVAGRDLVIRGNAARTVSADLVSANVRDTSLSLAFRADVESLQTSGYAFERARAAGRWQQHTLSGAVTVRQDSLVDYAASGSFERTSAGVQRIALDSVAARFDTLLWRSTHPARMTLDHGAVALDSVELRSNRGGRLFANGVIIASTGAVRLDVAAENVQVATVLRALQRDMDADGRLDASARLRGSRAAPEIVGQVNVRDAHWHGGRTPDGNAGIRYAARILDLDVTMHDSTNRRVLTGQASLPLNLALESTSASRRLRGPITADVVLDTFDLAALPIPSRSVSDIRGHLAGDVHARGSWDAPRFFGDV